MKILPSVERPARYSCDKNEWHQRDRAINAFTKHLCDKCVEESWGS